MGYAEYAPIYQAAGWSGVLPIPKGAKSPPPLNFTGWHAPDPDTDQIDIWRESAPDGNIALRLPDGVVGIDVDSYGDKQGQGTMSLARERWGKLPPTWVSSARDLEEGGIAFFRVEPGTRFPGKLEIDGVSNVEIIQRGHRFAVVYPSMHPNGSQYIWHDPQYRTGDIPNVEDLAWLPDPWIEGIQSSGRLFGQGAPKRDLTQDDALAELLKMNDALGDPCKVIKERLAEAIERLGQPGARHDAALLDSMGLISFAHHGHTGVVTALEELQAAFTTLVSADRAGSDAEYDRMIHGALARLEGDAAKEDPCAAEDERFENDVTEKLYRLRVTEEAKTRHNNLLAGKLEVPVFESAWDVAQTVPEVRDWLIEGLVPRRGVVSLSAAKKTGKSTIVQKMIESMLDETLFLDTFKSSRPNGSIHLIDLELDKATLGPWLTRNGVARREGVYVSSLYGHVTDLNIFNVSHREAIAERLREQNCKFLCIDPIGPYLRMLSADENDATEAGRAIDALVALKQLAQVDTLLLTLHAGHNSKGRARGSSVLLDTPDVNINLFKRSDDDKERHMSAEGRDVSFDLISFTYTVENGRGELHLLEGGTPDDARENDVIAVLEVLDSAAAIPNGNNPGVSQNRIAEALKTRILNCGKPRARKAIMLAVNQGFVRDEKTADNPRAPINHFLTEKGLAELQQVRSVLGDVA